MQTPEKWYRAFKTVTEMLLDRGFMIEPVDLSKVQIDNMLQFIDQCKGIVLRANRTLHEVEEKIIVFFDEGKLRINSLRDFEVCIVNEKAQSALIVSECGSTAKVNRELDLESQVQAKIQVFDLSSLIYNITKHAAVPRHRGVTKNEIDHMCKERKIKLDQFPAYSIDDPVVRYYGFTKGDVVEIQRNLGGSQPPYIIWRVIR